MAIGAANPPAFESVTAAIPACVGDVATMVQARVDAVALPIEVVCLPVMTIRSGMRGAVVEPGVDAVALAVEAVLDAIALAVHAVFDTAPKGNAAEIVCTGRRARGQQA